MPATQIGPDSYTYDTAGRLIRSTVGGKTESYEYDSFGNLLKTQIAGQPAVTIPVDRAKKKFEDSDVEKFGGKVLRKPPPRRISTSHRVVSSITEQGSAIERTWFRTHGFMDDLA